MSGVRIPPRRPWPRLKWTTRRDVAPEEAGSSPVGHSTLRESWAQRGLISHARWVRSPLPRRRADGATGGAAPLHGEGCGFESRPVHHADVAQLEEARRSDRRQCRFDSDRQYQLDVAQWERTGFGSRRLEVRVLPSRPMRGGGTGTTPGSEPGEPGSIPGLAAPMSLRLRPIFLSGQLRRTGFLLWRRDLRVCRSTRHRPSTVFPDRTHHPTTPSTETREEASWPSSRAPSGAPSAPT